MRRQYTRNFKNLPPLFFPLLAVSASLPNDILTGVPKYKTEERQSVLVEQGQSPHPLAHNLQFCSLLHNLKTTALR